MIIYNERTVPITFKRRELCDILLLASDAATTTKAKKWVDLHEKVLKAITDFDQKQGMSNG